MLPPDPQPLSPALPEPSPTVWMSPFPPPPPREAVAASPPVRIETALPAGEALKPVLPVTLWAALGNGLRWRLVLRMAAGEELTASTATRGSGLRVTTVRKHLGELRARRVIESRSGPDRREEIFFLPAGRCPEPGILDFGSCRIVLAEEPPVIPPAAPAQS